MSAGIGVRVAAHAGRAEDTAAFSQYPRGGGKEPESPIPSQTFGGIAAQERKSFVGTHFGRVSEWRGCQKASAVTCTLTTVRK